MKKVEDLVLDMTPVYLSIHEAINTLDIDGTQKYRYIILEGSSRSSKTISLIDIMDAYARSKKNKRITIWRDTKVDVIDTIFADLSKHFTVTGRWLNFFTFSRQKHTLSYKSKSTIEFYGIADDQKAMGMGKDIAWLNEPYKISRDIFDQIDQRTTEFVFIDWNPKMNHWIDDLKKHPRAIVLKSTFKDNPFCPPEQKKKILSYQPISECMLIKTKQLSYSEAMVYDCEANPRKFPKGTIELKRCQINQAAQTANLFNWMVYGLGEKGERPNRIFSWKEISLQEYHALDVPKYYGTDWGAVDPWAIGELKYYDGCLYVHELNYRSENEIRERLTNTERTQIGTAEDGIVSWMFNKLGVDKRRTVLCDPNRTTKIRALRASGWEYALAAKKPPGSIVDGIDLLNNLRVFYTNSSENIRYEQENYSRKVDRYGIKLEEPEDLDNHHMDWIRYVASHLVELGIIKKV